MNPNTNYFTAAFCKGNFTLLVKLKNPADFEKYSSLGLEAKKTFFNVKKTHARLDSSVLKRSADGAEHTSV